MSFCGWFRELDRQTERAIVEIERNLKAEKARQDVKGSFWRRLVKRLKERRTCKT